MILYVLRHAEAVEASDMLQDEWRYLTEKGRLAAKKVSSSIAKYGPKPRLTITSPLTRAVQTAEIAADKACRKNVVVASELLMPGADVSELVEHIKGCRDARRVLIVGHEPQLGRLVSTLLGREEQTIVLKKGACVTLELNHDADSKPANFISYLTPGKRRTSSFRKAFAKE